MKKILIILLAVAILAMAGIALAGINNTPHNIPQQYSGTKGGVEPCAFCHTPHVPTAQLSVSLVYPLWNRSQASQNYTMYSSSTIDLFSPGTTKTSAQLDASTRACMQCHNGVASGLINYPGRGNTQVDTKYNFSAGELGNFGDLGVDLQQEHPVSFTYVAGNDANGSNNFPAVSAGKISGLPVNYSDTAGASGSMMGCGTCHEPHNRFSYSGQGSTQVYFLRSTTSGNKGNQDSDLCKTCHVAKY